MERQRDEEVQQDDDQETMLNTLIKHSRSVAKVSGKNPYTVGDLDPQRKPRVGSGVRFLVHGLRLLAAISGVRALVV